MGGVKNKLNWLVKTKKKERARSSHPSLVPGKGKWDHNLDVRASERSAPLAWSPVLSVSRWKRAACVYLLLLQDKLQVVCFFSSPLLTRV